MSGFERDRRRPASASGAPARRRDASAAKPLDEAVKKTMEGAFGHDFSRVRVHADQESARQARSLGAQAFTVDGDLHFGAGRYRPDSVEGRELLAHELAHVVQQARGGSGGQAEERARAAAGQAARGEAVAAAALGGAPAAVQLQPEEPESRPAEKAAPAPAGLSRTLDEFGLNSATLTSKHRKAVDDLAAEIAKEVASTPGSRAVITVRGHTDTSGDEKHNKALGQKRAEAAKAALEKALARKKVGADRVSVSPAESAGEKELAKETADDVKEPLNRRVVITVGLEGPPVATPEWSAPSPEGEPRKEEAPRTDVILPPDLSLPPGYVPHRPPPYRPPEENLWEQIERQRKFIEAVDRKYKGKPKSLTDRIVEAVTDALEPVIEALPESWRSKARDAIRKGIESGTEKGCEAAIDASGVTGAEAEAMKSACKAALQTKPGEQR